MLLAVSNKKFLGEVLDADKDGRLEATLAATALGAWHGARVFRAHQVAATQRVLRHGRRHPRHPPARRVPPRSRLTAAGPVSRRSDRHSVT